MSGTLKPRWGHSTTSFCLVDGVTEVTMFGGTADSLGVSWEEQTKLADTTLLQFCMFIHDSTCMCMYMYMCNAAVFI